MVGKSPTIKPVLIIEKGVRIDYNIVKKTRLVNLVRFIIPVIKEVDPMLQVNVLEAKTDLSKLIRMLESNKEDIIQIARNGKPVVKMTSIKENPASNRIGIAKGKFRIKGDFDVDNEAIADELTGGSL